MNEEAIPDAQGQNAGPDVPGSQSEGSEVESQGSGGGVQSRINELTFARREAERREADLAKRLVAQDQQIAELVRSVTSRQQQPVEQQLPEMDPEQKRVLDAYFSRTVGPLQAEIESLRAHSVASQFIGDTDIANRAADLIVAWQRDGKTGWTPEDAVKFAAGEKVFADKSKGKAARDEKGRFNTMSQGVQGHSQQPSAAPLDGARPSDFDNWSSDKQLEYFEKRNVHGKAF